MPDKVRKNNQFTQALHCFCTSIALIYTRNDQQPCDATHLLLDAES